MNKSQTRFVIPAKAGIVDELESVPDAIKIPDQVRDDDIFQAAYCAPVSRLQSPVSPFFILPADP